MLSARPLIVAFVVVGLAAAWVVLTQGLPFGKSDTEQARDLLQPFVQALREQKFAEACALLAHTAPPKQPGARGCPSRLRRANRGDDWSSQLRSVDVIIEGKQSGKLYIDAFDPRSAFDMRTVYQFVLVRDNGALRIERFTGRF